MNVIEQYREAQSARRQAISMNRSLRMSGKPTLPVPELPPTPMGIEATEKDGTYIGTFQHSDNKAAYDELAAHGFHRDQVKLKPVKLA